MEQNRISRRQHVSDVPAGVYLLVGDIGGTNANFAIVEASQAEIRLLLSFHAPSQDIHAYHTFIRDLCQEVKQQYDVRVAYASLAVAGVIQNHCQCVDPTNLSVTIDAHQIAASASLERVVLLNDFEAVATGIDHVRSEDRVCVLEGDGLEHANKAALGAGTGLGKVGMVWRSSIQRYVPIASEGGHADFPAYDAYERACTEYIEKAEGKDAPASWEDVLSASGLRYMYQFLGTQHIYPHTAVHQEIVSDDYNPDKISQYAQDDLQAQDTFDLYARFYGRCAKNWVLDMAAFNGVYIAGGIAARNVSLFQHSAFASAFYHSQVHHELLRQAPVYVVTDYDVSLYGAAAYYHMWNDGHI